VASYAKAGPHLTKGHRFRTHKFPQHAVDVGDDFVHLCCCGPPCANKWDNSSTSAALALQAGRTAWQPAEHAAAAMPTDQQFIDVGKNNGGDAPTAKGLELETAFAGYLVRDCAPVVVSVSGGCVGGGSDAGSAANGGAAALMLLTG